MKNFISDNGGPLVIGVLFFGLVAGYIELRLPVTVDVQLSEAGLADPAKVEANTESIKDLEKADERMDNKIERIVDILLED